MKFSIRVSTSFRNFEKLSLLMRIFCFLIFLVICPHPANASSVEVRLQWDENPEPGISGYRIFHRSEGQGYNYDSPSWEGSETTCIIGGLEQGVRYFFVARTFNAEDVESSDSNEVDYYQAVPEPEPGTEPEVSEETNNDYGFNPYQPVLVSPVDGSTGVSLNPELRTDVFFNPNNGDTHYQTEWQISTDEDFSSLVFRTVSTICLEKLIVPELILDGDATYYWRVRFFDNSNTGSEWSLPGQFTTDDSYPVDTNFNGVPDDLEVDATVDLDNDGIPDRNQNDIKSMNTLLGTTQVGVKLISGNGVVDSVQIIDWDLIADSENRPEDMPMDLIGFKLKVDTGTQVQVAIYFSDQLPDHAGWYKYDVQNGWQDFSEHAVFTNTDDGRTIVFLELKDGGFGDADGVENGVIIDPSGPEFDRSVLSLDELTIEADQGDSGSSGGCFIAAGTESREVMSGYNSLLFLVVVFSGIYSVRRK